MFRVIFACIHNAGRSQMAAAFFNQLTDASAARASSAGTRPAEHVHPEVVSVMREAGLDLSKETPRLLTPQLARAADLLITMGCGEECPFIPGLPHEDWPLPDPKGQDLDAVRAIRDDVKARVIELAERENISISSSGWPRTAPLR